MKISKASWLYYTIFYTDKEEEIPKKMNLCKIFWKFCYGLCNRSIIAILLGIALVVGFFFSHRPPILKNDDEGKFMVPYKKWPTIKGKRIYPILVGYLVFPYGILHILRRNVVDMQDFLLFTKWLSPVFYLMVVIGVIFVIKYLLHKKEIDKLIIEYVKAKKEKVCPIVEFTD